MHSDLWHELKPHAVQSNLIHSPARFKVVVAGRRSGKTMLAKRHAVISALNPPENIPDYRIGIAAPTRDQAKRIYWADLKKMVPMDSVSKIMETELKIEFIHGSELIVIGMDKPERIEGIPWDGFMSDEYAKMKASAWEENIRPALSTPGREGWAWFIGVPRGMNHFHDLALDAQGDTSGEWAYFHWKSEDILDPKEIASAKSKMDPILFNQEYGASFVSLENRAYYPFERSIHASEPLTYNPNLPLIFCFDFNVDPGIAVIIQEQEYMGENENVAERITAVIGEVFIKRDSTTPMVCKKLHMDWKQHKGEIVCYGDATGGARGTGKVEGSDWDLIEKALRGYFRDCKINICLKGRNPLERPRVNAVNSRLLSADGVIHMLVDPKKAKETILDLEGVTLIPGSAGEILKERGSMRTHISDAIGYYLDYEFPVVEHFMVHSKF